MAGVPLTGRSRHCLQLSQPTANQTPTNHLKLHSPDGEKHGHTDACTDPASLLTPLEIQVVMLFHAFFLSGKEVWEKKCFILIH